MNVNENGFKNKITKLQIWSSDNETVSDVANSTTDISWKTDITTADELTFKFLISKDNYIPKNGDQVSFAWNGIQIFTGWIFKAKVSDDGMVSITAYGNSRYLKGTGTYVWQSTTSAERFERIMQDLRLPYKIQDRSSHRVEEEVTDGATFFDIINSAIKKTKSATGKRFFIIDDGDGNIVHCSDENLATDLLLGDGSNLTQWSLEHSIEDMSNIVQVIHEDSQTKARELRVARNEERIKKYGPLVHTETVSDDVNTAQLQDKANSLLGEKCGESKTLSIKALGDTKVRSGVSMFITIKEIENAGIPKNQRILVNACTHNFETNWTMDLEVKLI